MRARTALLAAAVLCSGWAHAAPVPPGSATTGNAKRALGTGALNLNTATLDQIDALPGISPAVAAAVVAERAARPFSRPEEMMRVQGVSKARFQRLRPHLTVTGPTSFVPAPGRTRPGRGKTAARPRPAGTRP